MSPDLFPPVPAAMPVTIKAASAATPAMPGTRCLRLSSRTCVIILTH